jgi:uncharacterized protein with PQ loop repeat
MVTVEAVGWAGTFTGTLLGLPQVVRLTRTRNVEGLSLSTWQALLAVNVAWTQHGLRIGQAPQVLTSVLSLCSTVPILVLMSREVRRPLPRVMLPGLLAAAAMIAVDRAFGTAAYGSVAVIPAVLANAGQSIELVRAPRVVGVSPLFLLLAAVNQTLWLTWALLIPDAGTAITAAVTGAGAAFNLGWWLARLAGLPPLFPRAQRRPAETPRPRLTLTGATALPSAAGCAAALAPSARSAGPPADGDGCRPGSQRACRRNQSVATSSRHHRPTTVTAAGSSPPSTSTVRRTASAERGLNSTAGVGVTAF